MTEDDDKLSGWEQDCADLNTDFYGEDTNYLQKQLKLQKKETNA